MAKPTDKQWAKAKALYGNGKSLREIEKAVGIPYKTVEYRAKKEGWSCTEVAQAIQDKVRVESAILHMDVAQKEIVAQEVAQQLEEIEKKRRYQEFLESATHKNLTHMMKKVIPYKDKNGIVIDPEASVSEHVKAQNALNRCAELLIDKNPDMVINNTNAQQNNSPADMLREIAERLPV